MANALAPSAPAGVPERFANPLQQIRGLLAQPAVRRAGPAAAAIGLVGAAALAWATLSTPPQKVLFPSLPDADKAAVTAALEQASIPSTIDDATGALTVAEDDHARARMLLAGQNLPKAAPGGYAILDQLPMGVSRAVEGERLRQARETELARSIQEIDAVAEARVHLAMPEQSVFVRDKANPSASVIIKLQAGRSLSDAQVGSVVNLVSSSVPGMKPDDVTVVDQLGALLSKSGGSTVGEAEGDRRIEFQRRIEDKYRQQLQQLLTPLVGSGNFTAEVQADVDLNETQATRETYAKQGALRAETGDWTGYQQGDAAVIPGGIPGALSNTPPPASTLQAPQVTPPGAAPAPAAGAPAPNPMKQQDRFQRAYDLDREVSVTRATPGGVKRLSVAVLLRDPENGRRTGAEVEQITNLVKSAVGFDPARQDNVTVVSRKFAGAPDAGDARPWWDEAWVPMAARNATALLIALLLLMFGVRPLVKAMTRRKEEPAVGEAPADAEAVGITVAGPVGIDRIEATRDFDERIDAVRGFTRDNPARAALAIRDMIKADAK